MIQTAHKLNDSHITNWVHDVICTNSYSLHSENMSCAMMTDIRSNVMMRAVELRAIGKILKRRHESDDAIFKKYIVNFSADDYYYLIGDNSICLVATLTKDISTAYLRSLDNNNSGIFEFGNYLIGTIVIHKQYSTCIKDIQMLIEAYRS